VSVALRKHTRSAAEIRLDQIVIAVPDWERSNQFYRNVLGAELVDVDSGRTAYRFGGR